MPAGTVICSSESSRARQTAEVVCAHLGAAEVVIAEALRERRFGQWEGLPADNFERVLGAAGWRLDYLGTSTYVGRFAPDTIERMQSMSGNAERAERMKRLQDRLQVIAPLLEDHRVHMPIWAVVATRLD